MAYQHQSYPLDAGRLGQIEGLTLSLRGEPLVHYFGGIPYALPPTGEFRFRAPRKLPEEFQYGTVSSPGRFTGGTAICPQPPARTPQNKALFDEDCLQLNIWIPAEPAPKEGWPVCVYFHGGFLQVGSPNLGPGSLAPLLTESACRAIMVFPAFRLNAFGFLASEEHARALWQHGLMGSESGSRVDIHKHLGIRGTHRILPLLDTRPAAIQLSSNWHTSCTWPQRENISSRGSLCSPTALA
jgi:hypothetical protein